uniref:Thyroid hormone receptor-associated protein complex subunit n=2 Tax=Haemonchus contortus TaxID=6289 RepID=A0A7I4XY13_HAECO
MRSVFSTFLVIALIGCIVESKIYRCKRSSRRCGRNEAPTTAPESLERPRVIWSSDGKIGNRYFESDGRYFVEIQELVPIPGGKYQIVKKVVETGQPPNVPPDQRESPAGTHPDQSGQPGSYHPALGDRPDSSAPSHSHSPDQGPPSYPHYGGGQPHHPQHYGRGDSETMPPVQYDETWYEPPGQTSYPRLLFSPHHGWREMNEDEVRRVRRIQPLADYDPLLSSPVDRLPDQEGRGQPSDPRERRPYPHEMHRIHDQHPSPQQGYPSSSSHGHYPDHAQHAGRHPGSTPESSEEEVNPTVERRTDSHGRTWILREGRWHPLDGSENMDHQHQAPPAPEHEHRRHEQHEAPPGAEYEHRRGGQHQAPPAAEPEHRRGEWVFRNGMWHRDPQHQDRNLGREIDIPLNRNEPVTSRDGWVMRDGSWHYEPTQPAQNEVQDVGSSPAEGEKVGDGWVLRDGVWYYEPQGGTTTRPPPQPETVRGGDGWVLRDGTWYYEPQNHQPYARLPGAAYHDGVGQWEFHDGSWHFVTPQHGSHAHAGGVEGHLTHHDHDDRMGNVRRVHVPSHDHGDHGNRLVEKVVSLASGSGGDANKSNDTSVDYRNWSYSYYEQGGDGEADAEMFESDPSEGSGQQPSNRLESPQFIEQGNMAAVVYPDEGAVEPGKSYSSYFIRDGDVGAMVYTEGGVEENQKIAQASTDEGFPPNGPNILSVDDYKRLQPSLSSIVPMQVGAAHLSCDGVGATDEMEEFWLIRTTPCGDSSPEGRILMPNGDILKFYGYPKLVRA